MDSRAQRCSLVDAPSDPPLDDFELAAFGVRDVVAGGHRSIEAYALDRDGVRHRLALWAVVRDAKSTRASLFGALLARGLRARAPILVDASGCATLRARAVAAWGAYAVLVG